VRGLLASGVAERAIRHSGEASVRKGLTMAIQSFRKSDRSYAFKNEWRFVYRAFKINHCTRGCEEWHPRRKSS
jgi:hypothetical protein